MELANNKITVATNGDLLKIKNPDGTQGRINASMQADFMDISKNLTVDGIFDLSGNADLSSNLIVRKNVDICGNIFIDGDFTVMGDKTIINVVRLDISDNNITLGKTTDISGTDDTADGGGITLKGTVDKTLTFDNLNDNWTSSEHWNIADQRTYKINNIDFYKQGDMDISSSLTTDNVIEISANHLRTANVLDIRADALTSGKAIHVQNNNSAACIGSLVNFNMSNILNKATVLYLQQNGNTVDSRVIDISSGQVAGNIIDIAATNLTTGNVFDINADTLTSGNVFDINADSITDGNVFRARTSSIRAFTMIDIQGSGATGASTVMKLVSNSTDSSAKALDISGNVTIKTLVNVADAIKLHADAGAAQTISLLNDEGSTDGTQSAAGVAAGAINISATDGGIGLSWNDAKDLWAEGGRAVITANENATNAIVLDASNTAGGGIDMDAGAGGIAIDTADGGAISIDAIGAPSNFTLASTADADDLTIAVTGTNDSSLILSSTGTGADSLQIQATAGTGAGGIDIDAGAGGIDILTTGTLSIDGQDTTNLTMTADAAGTKTMTIKAANSNAGGVGNIDMDADGTVSIDGAGGINIGKTADVAIDIDSAGLDIDASGQVNIDSSQAAVTAIVLKTSNSAGGIDIDAGAGGIDILTTGTLSIDGQDTTNLTMTADAAGTKTMTIKAANSNAFGVGNIDMDADGTVSIDGAGGINIGTAANVAIDINSAAFELDGSTVSLDATDTTNLTMTADAAGTKTMTIKAINSNAGGTADIDMDADGTISIDSTSTTNGIKIGTNTSGVPISIGHTTSEVTINDNLTVTGNLVVTGITTTVKSTTVTIEDPVFTLAGDNAAENVPLHTTQDKGIEFHYWDGGAKIGFMGYDQSAGKFMFLKNVSVSGAGVYSGTAASLDTTINSSTLATFGSALEVTGGLTTDTLKATGTVDFEAAIDAAGVGFTGGLNVAGGLTADTLKVTSTSEFTGAIDAAAAGFTGGLKVTGGLTADSFKLDGVAIKSGSLSVIDTAHGLTRAANNSPNSLTAAQSNHSSTNSINDNNTAISAIFTALRNAFPDIF